MSRHVTRLTIICYDIFMPKYIPTHGNSSSSASEVFIARHPSYTVAPQAQDHTHLHTYVVIIRRLHHIRRLQPANDLYHPGCRYQVIPWNARSIHRIYSSPPTHDSSTRTISPTASYHLCQQLPSSCTRRLLPCQSLNLRNYKHHLYHHTTIIRDVLPLSSSSARVMSWRTLPYTHMHYIKKPPQPSCEMLSSAHR